MPEMMLYRKARWFAYIHVTRWQQSLRPEVMLCRMTRSACFYPARWSWAYTPAVTLYRIAISMEVKTAFCLHCVENIVVLLR